jgi:hypothetical protein
MSFKWVEWTGKPAIRGGPRVFFHRLANAARWQVGPVCISWPMPWSKVCHGKGPGDCYGHGHPRWHGILTALGWDGKKR